MSKPKPFILIDGSSYLYRAFHALPPLTNSHGEPTGAIYGVANMIRKLLNQYEPEYIAVIFDAKGRTFRDEMYEDYKAHRPPMPDDLQRQIEPLKNLIQAMGLPLLEIEGVEADDVIATLAIQAKKNNLSVLISTGDKDMAQLVDEQIHLINTMTGVILDEKGVLEKFGIKPAQIIDYLALIGDTVDNVPGVPKVGPKTAVKWLEQYQTLENIMACANEITGKIGENLRNALETLPLSKQLVTLRSDMPLPFNLPDLKYEAGSPARLLDMVKNLEFKGWLQELLSGIEKRPVESFKYHTVLTDADWQKWYKELLAAKEFAFDTETTSLNAIDAEIVGFSFAFKPFEAVYVPLAHDYEGAPQQLHRELVLNQLKVVLEDPKKIIIGHNLKYDMNVLANHGIKLNAQLFDTMLESYVLDSTVSRHNLDALALKFLNRKTILFEDVAGKGVNKVTFNKVSLDQATAYACQDADVALQLHQQFWPKFLANDVLKTVLLDIELPLLPVLAQIERNGVMIDADKLAKQSESLAERINQLEQEAFKIAGAVFNLASPKQLQEILYQKLQLPILSKTPTGIPSTAEDVLQELAALDYPLPKIILEYRGLCKLKSTYTDALPKQISARTDRVHTSYNQAVTATGRLSSTEPNLQNIPIKNEEGRRIRQAFIARPGYKIISADYSQIELRIMAHLSQDAGLLSAFAKEIDIHTATAAEVFNLPLEQIAAEQRRHAKAINFGLIYGMSAFGLAKQLNIDRQLAQKYMDLYFKRYPNVQLYMETIRELARKQGYVETLLGRRLYVPEINASNLQRRRGAERAAINAPMQGTAADIIKIAMISLHAWLLNNEVDAKIIMQVHDELVFEVAEADLDRMLAQIEHHMTKAVKLSVPLVIHASYGDNWDEAH